MLSHLIMTVIKFDQLLLFLFISYCHAVSIDYYSIDNADSESDNQEKNKPVDILQGIDMLEDTLRNNTVVNKSTYYSISNVKGLDAADYNDDNMEIYVDKFEDLDTFVTKLIGRTDRNFTNISSKYRSDAEIIPNIPGVVPYDINGDYQYAYDYEYPNITIGQHSLRHEIQKFYVDSNQTTKYNTTFVNIVNDSKTDIENNTLKYTVDFYNLQPAAEFLNYENSFGNMTFTNSNVWYVPERYSCWELPILYGELGLKESVENIFLVYSGSLKNVFHVNTDEDTIKLSQSYAIPTSQTLNKWCATPPCYGDHTLCLFSEKSYSKLCMDGYTVSIPSTVERIGLVNTINSMRNRVANGDTDIYHHLPPAANMKQIIYDFDLEKMAEAWLAQCLPGPAPCSALDENYVVQLECTKYLKYCCIHSYKIHKASRCIPKSECFVDPIIGCIHTWFWSAGQQLTSTDVDCGHLAPATFNTVQLIWADTNKIGCAYGEKQNGDIRVVCNFAPGAPFYIDTKYYCGFITHKSINFDTDQNITNEKYLASVGIHLTPVRSWGLSATDYTSNHVNYSLKFSDIDILSKIYERKWVRQKLGDHSNGTMGLLARLVTRYTFSEDSDSRCDKDEPIYQKGKPGSLCVERGRRFHALCYDFRDPTPGYRLAAVLAPVALFSLILYDLFSGVVRQTNY